MNAVGIDLGGTKIACQVFGPDWQIIDSRRVPTPGDYDALVAAVAGQVAWATGVGDGDLPVGIGAAGLVNPETGLALTANLPASGRPFPRDLEKAAGRPLTFINDCRAMTLSEAAFGAGRGARTVLGLIIGTGIGGGIAIDGHLLPSPTQTGGEFGHTSAPAHLVTQYNLPVVTCGCGRMGCVETYLAGPGMSRIAEVVTGQSLTPPQIAQARGKDPQVGQIWDIWCAFAAELLRDLTLTVDPEVIVLGGGISQIEGLLGDLAAALASAQFDGFACPSLKLAEGGEISGARGAALAAYQEVADV